MKLAVAEVLEFSRSTVSCQEDREQTIFSKKPAAAGLKVLELSQFLTLESAEFKTDVLLSPPPRDRRRRPPRSLRRRVDLGRHAHRDLATLIATFATLTATFRHFLNLFRDLLRQFLQGTSTTSLIRPYRFDDCTANSSPTRIRSATLSM